MAETSRKPKPRRMPPGAPMEFEPQNELGVIYLFSHVAKRKYGLRIEQIRPAFPDCIAYRDGKKIRIEFEFKSSSFRAQRHSTRGCDWIVCWIHDWPAVPSHLQVKELRREYGMGFNVWFQSTAGERRERISSINSSSRWSVPLGASVGDLILYYRSTPDRYVRDVFKLTRPVEHVSARWKKGKDWMGPIRRVCTLRAPLHLEEMKANRLIREAGFVRGSMRGRQRATPYWPELYRMIVERNPSVERSLKKYGPHRVV